MVAVGDGRDVSINATLWMVCSFFSSGGEGYSSFLEFVEVIGGAVPYGFDMLVKLFGRTRREVLLIVFVFCKPGCREARY